MGLLTDPTIHDMAGVQRNFDALAQQFIPGLGTPEGNVKAKPTAFYLQQDGAAGSLVWVKTTQANDPTGWVAIA